MWFAAPRRYDSPSRRGACLAGIGDFIAEIKRRRVVRAVLGWGILSFAVLQIYEPVMHGLHLPEWTLTLVVVVLGVGFPATFVLAWIFDMGPGGVERTPSAPGEVPTPAQRVRTALLLIGLGLLISVPGWAWYARHDRARSAAPSSEGGSAPVQASPVATAGPSIAVLPFVNMSGDPENEYFSDGLSEEILNALAQVPGLRVPARTSSFFFKGKTQDVARIAEALRVATILEGSVRKAGGRVRVTAQLVNAADGYHIWSQTFDRDLKDVFAVQDEIAAAITGALKLRLAPGTASPAGKAGTTANPRAYEAYLRGRHELNDRSRASIEKAIVHLDRAVALDPGFAVAYADKAIAVGLLGRGNYGEIPLSQAVARAMPFLAKAQALAPEHPEVLAAAGFVAGNAYDPERALGYLDRSLAQNPSNGEVLNWRKGILESLGRYELVLAAAADAARADPLSKLQVSNYIDELVRFGTDSELGPTVERLRKLDEGWGQMALGLIAQGRGDRAGAIHHFLPALQLGCDLANPRLALVLSDLGLTEESLHVPGGDPVALRLARGDVAGAEVRALAGLRRAPGDIDARTDLFFVRYAAGRFGEAAELAGRIYDDLHGTGLEPIILIDMAVAAREASRPAEASRYSEQSRQLIDRFARAGLTPLILDFYRGRLAAYDGQDDRAVALLQRALTATGFSWGRADLDHPVFARLLRRPDYVTALKKLDAILAAQRARVVDMLCGPKRISETWQPAPETCAGATPSP